MYFLFSSPFLSYYIYISLSLSFSCPISLYVYMCTRILLIISAFQPPHSPRPWSWFSNSPTFPPPPRGQGVGTWNTRHIYLYIYHISRISPSIPEFSQDSYGSWTAMTEASWNVAGTGTRTCLVNKIHWRIGSFVGTSTT